MQKCVFPSRRECPIFVASWMATAMQKDFAALCESSGPVLSAGSCLSASGPVSASANDANVFTPGAKVAGNPTTD